MDSELYVLSVLLEEVFDVVDTIILQEADHSWRYHPKRRYLSQYIDTHFSKCVLPASLLSCWKGLSGTAASGALQGSPVEKGWVNHIVDFPLAGSGYSIASAVRLLSTRLPTLLSV